MDAASKRIDLPMPRIKEFEHHRRFWMPKHEKYGIKVVAGDYYVSNQDELITTVLGSCISVCIRDPTVGVGGINHFLLPDADSSVLSSSNRYGVFAMEKLINAIIKYGGQRKNFEIKVVGGGNMISGVSDIGQCNILFIKSFMELEGFTITAQDLGGFQPRKILYNVKTGKLLVNKLKSQHHDKYVTLELEHQRRNVAVDNSDGDIELFD